MSGNILKSVFIIKLPTLWLGSLFFSCIALSFFLFGYLVPQKGLLLHPLPYMDKLSFGYHEVLADAMWIRAVQDLDYCEEKTNENLCRNQGWLYQMLETVTNLSPQFRVPYAAGALALTVVISDIDGATKIFEKGIKAFPRDWPLLYRAAYHYLYEVKDNKRAADLLVQAGQNGAPPWVFSLASRLYSDSGNLELAESLVVELEASGQDPVLLAKLKDKIKFLRDQKRNPQQ
jgi:hypothetical protein